MPRLVPEGARHEAMAREATEKRHVVTAAEAFIRASIYYHYGKHLFADHPEEFRAAHDAMLRCYSAGVPQWIRRWSASSFLTKAFPWPAGYANLATKPNRL